MSYWLISLPSSISVDQLNQYTQRANYSTNYVFPIPQLKIGTLDSLMSLSEELQKIDPVIHSIVLKFEKSYTELITNDTVDDDKSNTQQSHNSNSVNKQLQPSIDLRVDDNTSAVDYIKKFKWNDIRFNKRVALNQLIDTAVNECTHADEDLKKKQGEYSEIKSQLTAIERVEFGSLQTRSLSEYIKSNDIIDTENLCTLFVVVPRSRANEFQSEYAEWNADITKLMKQSSITNEHKQSDISSIDTRVLPGHIKPVVPGSLRLIYDGINEDSILYRVIVLRKGADQYKQALRDHRVTVRVWSESSGADELSNKQRYTELKHKRKQLWNHLVRFTKTMYGELYINFIHIKAIRLYVESVLRYGLPVDIKAILIEPHKSKERNLRDALKKLFQYNTNNKNTNNDAIDAEATMNGLDNDEFYPYVYVPLKVSE